MKLYVAVRSYFAAFSKTAVRLLLLGMVPLYAALGFLLFLRFGGTAPGGYDLLWMQNNFAYWVDSFGVSLLLLLAGAAVYDYAEKYDEKRK